MDPNLQNQLFEATEKFLSEDEDLRLQSLQFLTQFRESNFLLFIQLLSAQLCNQDAPPAVRIRSAVFIFGGLHKRTPELHRAFVSEWLKVTSDLRRQVLASATSCIGVGDEQFQNQVTQLLGLIYSIELTPGSPNPEILRGIEDIVSMCTSGTDDQTRIIATNILSKICLYSLEIQINCAHEAAFLILAPILFNVFVNNMTDGNFPGAQQKTIDALTESLLVFKRVFSFENNQDLLMPKIFDFLAAGDPEFLQPIYFLLRKIVDDFYQYTDRHIKAIRHISIAHLRSGDPPKQIEACFLWLTIGDVEADISQEDKRFVKLRHRDISQCYGYSRKAFPKLFLPLVDLIISTGVEEVDAHISLEHSPEHAAFSCLSSITKATDAEALGPIFEFVKEQSNAEDWRFRYASGLLLSAASQLPSFNESPENILQAFTFFVEAVGDAVPRIVEVAMWSLGRMVKSIPELILDPERFVPLCGKICEKLNISCELTSRACWLLNACFNCFSSDDETSFIAHEFTKFADLLLGAIQAYPDADTDDAAFGALNRLIERTPSNLSDEYTQLFQKVTSAMGELLQAQDNTTTHHQMVGYCSIVQAIIMNVSELILPHTEELMGLLNAALGWSDLVGEVLPAMGAVARAIGPAFEKYGEASLEMIFSLLGRQEYVHPAAIFVGDICSAGISFPDDVTNHFVEALFATFEIDELPSQARIASFSALGEIVKQVRERCDPWLEHLLTTLEAESKSALAVDDENADLDYAKSFALVMLQIYQTLVPILVEMPRGDRKVRNFFHIFEKISKFNTIDDAVLPEALILIHLIATIFGRKMNVYLNKPTVLSLLKKAMGSEDSNISELATQTLGIVRAC